MWYNVAINRVIKFVFPTLNILKSYTVTYDINVVDDTLRGARGACGFSGCRTTPWETPMNLMFSYSRVVAGHPPMADSVRRTSEKLVGPYLPRPLTSPSCGAPCHPAQALTGVGCERVSGTSMETLIDDHGELLLITVECKSKQKIVYGAGDGYSNTGTAAGCKAGPAASSLSNRGLPEVGRQAPGRAHASGEEDTVTGGTRRGTEEPDVMIISPGTSWDVTRRRGGGGRGGGGSDDELPLCSPSPAVVGTLDKRPYRRIAGSAEGTASAANGRDGGTGRRTRRGDTSTGDSDSALLPAPDKRKKRGAGRTPTPIPTPRPLL